MTKDGLSKALETNEICVDAANRVCLNLFDAVDPVPRNVPSLQKNCFSEVLSAEGFRYRPERAQQLKERLCDVFGGRKYSVA